jgi:hypothetical protein
MWINDDDDDYFWRFMYATDPEGYTIGSLAIGRSSLAGLVKR